MARKKSSRLESGINAFNQFAMTLTYKKAKLKKHAIVRVYHVILNTYEGNYGLVKSN